MAAFPTDNSQLDFPEVQPGEIKLQFTDDASLKTSKTGGDPSTSKRTRLIDPAHEARPQNRVAKRVLHFSDGILEEYSDDEVDGCNNASQTALVDPKTLTWVPYFLHMFAQTATTTLKVCDWLGERLANVFGITTPKYQYVIDEQKRQLERENMTEPIIYTESGTTTTTTTKPNTEEAKL